MSDFHMKPMVNEIQMNLNDDEMLIQLLYETIVDHHELLNLKLVHFELMVKLFLYVEHDVDHI